MKKRYLNSPPQNQIINAVVQHIQQVTKKVAQALLQLSVQYQAIMLNQYQRIKERALYLCIDLTVADSSKNELIRHDA